MLPRIASTTRSGEVFADAPLSALFLSAIARRETGDVAASMSLVRVFSAFGSANALISRSSRLIRLRRRDQGGIRLGPDPNACYSFGRTITLICEVGLR